MTNLKERAMVLMPDSPIISTTSPGILRTVIFSVLIMNSYWFQMKPTSAPTLVTLGRADGIFQIDQNWACRIPNDEMMWRSFKCVSEAMMKNQG